MCNQARSHGGDTSEQELKEAKGGSETDIRGEHSSTGEPKAQQEGWSKLFVSE